MKRFLIVVLFCSCSVLRKESASNTNHLQEAQRLNSSLSSHQSWTILSNDSLSNETFWRIWPKGNVSYLRDSGFRGEAVLIEIQQREMRKINAKAKGTDSTSLSQQLNVETTQKQIAESHTRVGNKDWYWAIGIGLGLILCLRCLWKLLQNSVS
ncbi:hypothetical protein [Pedobacter sp. BMA]|uniref:hypothetical protein n=1 Tax=Pedobacter sp. BMA TaxID=1663685 RepID=UPI00064B71E2|nr:hypothetical protein [Pedobacter sp. BMA]KLT64031.1 hypothetical protein AB669_18370 [Pedobacter sp. BMA]